MKTAVIRFPGSNCDRDIQVALRQLTGHEPTIIWHSETTISDDIDFIAIPGGFSYGDYLRSGALAGRSAIMKDIVRAAERGVPIIGICNGFQILTETRLLPGALIRNSGLDFVCRNVLLTANPSASPMLAALSAQTSYSIPVAHHDGNYFADDETLDMLEGEGKIAFRYQDNPNGSMRNIAGVVNARGNVLGMMPHPERAVDPACGGTHGATLLNSMLNAVMATA
ncbi:phosphoribosylformylglycinamidine synthase subunit PurQ [Alterisphingorhabdus coralli]|uniref:Phosphoribosylformylglycinamidine synthase subunit PurQ n=1 Tax=Alterisphingorhabdus coralli TaxID=3071408 RepID=A0AA97F690_9SPHN|nr:phosphoribosylformylglycinamidine synthase subunit PurQ [Parasphingorhabdus sp. SCSIO 66989]WOE74226.1 phosphoribosylformylglycinamidine synthase subunit PurQ [Parasphingorhabdus sp. SCSIO 66989]